MINLMLKNIFENGIKIDTITKHINRLDRYNTTMFFILLADIYLLVKLSKKHDDKINELEDEIKELKSKGE